MFESIFTLFENPYVFDAYLIVALAMFLFYCKTLNGGSDVPWFLDAIRWLTVALSGSILWPVVFVSWIITRFWRWSIGA